MMMVAERIQLSYYQSFDLPVPLAKKKMKMKMKKMKKE